MRLACLICFDSGPSCSHFSQWGLHTALGPVTTYTAAHCTVWMWSPMATLLANKAQLVWVR